MCKGQGCNIQKCRQGSEPTSRTSQQVMPDLFVLGAVRSAKWHVETVDSHHMGGQKALLLTSENVSGASMIYLELRHPLLMLWGCNWISIASLISRSMYPVLAESNLASCRLILLSQSMLCSTKADFPACINLMCLPCSFKLCWNVRSFCSTQIFPHTQGMLQTPGILKPRGSLTGGRK